MKNLKTYDNFINEGLFSSKYKKLLNKIHDYIIDMDLNDIRHEIDSYHFIMKKDDENMKNIEVVIIRKISFEFCKDFDYSLKINGDVVDGVSNYSVWKLWDLIEKLKNKREKLRNSENDPYGEEQWGDD